MATWQNGNFTGLTPTKTHYGGKLPTFKNPSMHEGEVDG